MPRSGCAGFSGWDTVMRLMRLMKGLETRTAMVELNSRCGHCLCRGLVDGATTFRSIFSGLSDHGLAATASWFETLGSAELLTRRVRDLSVRSTAEGCVWKDEATERENAP